MCSDGNCWDYFDVIGDAYWMFTSIHCDGKFRYSRTHCKDAGCITEGSATLSAPEGDPAPAGFTCTFPFEYKGVRYSQCITLDNPVPWCFHRVNATRHGMIGYWGNCSSQCNSSSLEAALPRYQRPYFYKNGTLHVG